MPAGLRPLYFRPLPLGAVRPAGWLARQLRIQADGLSGSLDEFWPDLRDSGWIGGKAEGWERGPYWLDGIVPLGVLLDDAALKAKAQRWMDYILSHQHEDGWLGPVTDSARGRQPYDPWPRFVLLKAMTQWQEATGDQRIIPAMLRFLRKLDGVLTEQPLRTWGRARWADLVLSIHWLWERQAEPWLLELAAKVRSQGLDWQSAFADPRYRGRNDPAAIARFRAEDGNEDPFYATHVVNNAMAVKAAAVWFRQSHDAIHRKAVFEAIELLDRFHGQATGLFSGDEHLAGRHPSQGTELCAVVEYLFSLEVLLSILGEAALGDRLEKIAFNALPATFSPDMWAHQYDQQANQVLCAVVQDRIYTNNGPDANIFGLEPNFGCCTANMHQGWPKFAAHLWMASADGGLAAVAYAPCEVSASVGGTKVKVQVSSDYPFGEEIQIHVAAEPPARFPLHLRIPTWASGAVLSVDGHSLEATAGTFCRIDRQWGASSAVTLRFPMRLRVSRRFNDAACIAHGPLVYSVAVGEQWRLLRGEPPHADWEVHPTTPWNYALELDVARPEQSLRLERGRVGPRPFSVEGAPVRIRARGRRVAGWGLVKNAADAPPPSPVKTNSPLEELTLLPYGCARLRVTEIPVAE